MPFKSEKQRRYLFANEPEVAKKFSEDYNKGGVASMFRKKQADGTDPQYEGWKKIYETNPELAALNDKHDEYLEKYTLEMSTSDAGEAGILGTEEANMEFVEADDGEEVMVDDRINLMAAAPEKQPFLSSDQSATTLFMSEGGRIGFQGGGKDAGKDSDFGSENYGGGNGGSPSPSPSPSPSYNYKGPTDLGVTTRTVNKVTAPPATTRIGGKTYDVTPETKSIRDRAEVKAQIMRTPPSTKKFKIIDPITKTTLTSDKKTKKGFGGFSLLDVVLFVGSSGLINPEVTKIAKAISNVKTGLKFSSLVSDKTKTKGVKETAKDILTKVAKDQISKKTGIDVKTIDTTLDTIEKALDTKLGKSVVDKFNSLNTTKNNTTKNNTTKNNTTKTTTFTGGDNDGPDPVIIPVVPEFLEEKVIVEEPTASLSNAATLDLIRNRQNTRRSFFNANSGGLAGLFKVKKQ